ncbi:MAG TPA: helix-turn-helix domain-containing protein [Candidatus Limnocylindria bacterium]|nr:helix-turn-helix domain-containing protein [Candidatus Limnocylindria bacterium]
MPAKQLSSSDRELWWRRTREAGYDSHELARLYGVTERHLRRKSEDMVAQPLHLWLREQRLIAATHYLLETESVKQAAHQAHYRRVATFIEHFQQYHEISPACYLQWHRRQRRSLGWNQGAYGAHKALGPLLTAKIPLPFRRAGMPAR